MNWLFIHKKSPINLSNFEYKVFSYYYKEIGDNQIRPFKTLIIEAFLKNYMILIKRQSQYDEI
jgi:hypothetical protein